MVSENLAATEYARELVEIVNTSPTRTVAGSLLAQALKLKHPEFHATKFGCVNLRGFIMRFVPQIRVVRLAGLDLVYGLASDASTGLSADTSKTGNLTEAYPEAGTGTQLESPPAISVRRHLKSGERFDAAVYKTFANPKALLAIYGDRQTGELRAQGHDESAPPGDWVKIPSMTTEMHADVARAYLASRSPDERNELEPLIGAGPNWHATFWHKTGELSIERDWQRFRADCISQKLVEVLGQFGVPFKPISSRPLRGSSIAAGPTQQVPTNGQPQDSRGAAESLLRKVAMKAVAGMSTKELRAIRLSLGEVLDVLAKE